MTDRKAKLASLAGGLIVSCQAYSGEPLQNPRSMLLMAQSVVRGGAAGIRAQGVDDIRLIHQHVHVPLIGLLKIPGGDVFITPTVAHARAVVAAGADIVAVDGTRRRRPDGLSLASTIQIIHEETGALVMADTASLDDGAAAEDAGADIIGTTLAGYVGQAPLRSGPDIDLVRGLVARVDKPVLAEGRISTPQEAAQAIDAGAFGVVVGTAITHPESITARFAEALRPQR